MRLLMMGTGTFAEPTFEALLSNFGSDVVGLVTQPDRDSGNKRGSTRQTGKGMTNIAHAAGVPVAQPESINNPEGLAQLHEVRPDLMVVAAYGQILSRDVLTVPTVGTINVHASLLPKYRGAAPVAYAILNGEEKTGVTIIKVTPGLDSGEMILQESLDILPDDTTGTLEARLAVLGAKLAVEAVRKYQAGGPVEGVKQDPALVTKAPKIKKEFGLIDWNQRVDIVRRHILAMQPWPTAYTFLHRPGKEPLRVLIAKVGQTWASGWGMTAGPIPGTALSSGFTAAGVKRPGFSIACAQGEGLDILEIQPAGKKSLAAEEFLRGYPIVEGMMFGPEKLA